MIYDGTIISSKFLRGCGCATGTAKSRTIAILRAYELDERFVLADTSLSDAIFATTLHDATYARIWRSGIG
jgi:hypothetical protein